MAEVFKRKGSDKWQCYVWEPGPGGKFKRRPVSTRIVDDGTKKSQQNAEAVARTLQSTAATGEAVTRKEISCKAALERLTSRLELAGRNFETIKAVVYRGANVVGFYGEKRSMSSINVDEAVLAFARHARQSREPITVADELQVLRRMIIEAGLKPVDMPEVGDTTPKPQKLLTPDQARALWLGMPHRRKLTVQAYLQLGLRRSEPWKIANIDFESGWASIAGTKTKGSVREAPVPDELLAALYTYKHDFRQAFPHWESSGIGVTMTAVARRIGIVGQDDYLSVNDTRGTYASHQAMAGTPIVKLASYMGTSIKMLETYYVQIRPDESSRKEAQRGTLRIHSTGPRDLDLRPKQVAESDE